VKFAGSNTVWGCCSARIFPWNGAGAHGRAVTHNKDTARCSRTFARTFSRTSVEQRSSDHARRVVDLAASGRTVQPIT
jgi:hypothetical protein